MGNASANLGAGRLDQVGGCLVHQEVRSTGKLLTGYEVLVNGLQRLHNALRNLHGV